MSKKKTKPENNFDFLETKYGAPPGEIIKAIKDVGPYKARLETYFLVKTFMRNKTKQNPAMVQEFRSASN